MNDSVNYSEPPARAGSEFPEAVAAPLLGTDPVVHDEQSVWVVFLLDLQQPWIVVAPVRLLKSFLEVVALAAVRAAVRSNLAQFSTHRSMRSADYLPLSSCGSCPGIPGYAGPWPSATIASVNAFSTDRFVAVSFAHPTASAGAPQRFALLESSASVS